MTHNITMFTDGACSGNPGAGGYGVILSLNDRNYKKEFSEGFIKTTNNRMELMAIIEGLKKIRLPAKVKILSDSKYVVDAVSKGWLFSWEKKKFKGKKNTDLWREFLKYYRRHEVHFEWIKGHSGHAENERCDNLAVTATKGPNLRHDNGFEKNVMTQ